MLVEGRRKLRGRPLAASMRDLPGSVPSISQKRCCFFHAESDEIAMRSEADCFPKHCYEEELIDAGFMG